MARLVEFFSVTVSDSIDGRGIPKIVVNFSNEEAAKEYVKEHPGDIYTTQWIVPQSFMVYDDVEDAKTAKTDKKKATALAKLTKEERELLGL